MSKCKKCNNTREIWYYYDAGDHFSAGPSPYSGWRSKPCECVEQMKKEKEASERTKFIRKLMKKSTF